MTAPSPIVGKLSTAEQARLREQIRRLRRWCPLLRLPIVLWLARHRSASESAAWLLCSRSSVYEVAACGRQGLGWRWKRAKLVAPDKDAERIQKRAHTNSLLREYR